MQHLAHEFKAMGTPCSFQLHAHGSEQLHRLAQQLIADVQRLEAKYSRYRPDSVLSQINQVAMSGGSVTVDEETGALLHYADTCFQQSDGLFDITSGVLAQVWHKGRTDVPSQAELDAPLARVGWGRLQWTGAELVFPLPGMQLDLGGIVKEYAADRLASMCREAGVHHGFINLGGDLCVVGPQPSGDPWLVGIRSPQDAAGDGTRVPVSVGALASSGDYERFLHIGGQRYGHILNPLTGWPTRSMVSVTVWAPLCVMAGSAATIAMLKEDDGPAWLDKLGLPFRWEKSNGDAGGNLQALQ